MARFYSSNSHRHRHHRRSHHRKQQKRQGKVGHPWLWSLSFDKKKVNKREMNPYQSIADFDPRLQAGAMMQSSASVKKSNQNMFSMKGSQYRRILKDDLQKVFHKPSSFTRWDYLILVKAIHQIIGHKHYFFRPHFPHPVIDVLYTKKHDQLLNTTLDSDMSFYEPRPKIDALNFRKRYRFWGTFIRSGIAEGQRVMLLFKNVHIIPSGERVAKHLWIECSPSIIKLGQLQRNDWILFTAKPTMYEKYYNYKAIYEFGLRDIRNADRVQSWLDATSPEMPMNQLALTGYVMLANCHFYAQTHWFNLKDPAIEMFHVWEQDHVHLKIPHKFKL